MLTVYDENGNYGHPDHIQVHRVGVRAGELAGTPRVYESDDEPRPHRGTHEGRRRPEMPEGVDRPTPRRRQHRASGSRRR